MLEPRYEKLPGSRLSISNIEYQIPIYERFKESGKILLEEFTTYNQEELEHFAKISFTGTQLHNFVYFQRLFNRCQMLKRFPSYDDLRDTFPTTQLDESEAIAQLYTEFENPKEVWREWIINSEIPKKKNSATILDPEIIKGIWDSGIYNPNTKDIINNQEEPNLGQVEMHEVLTILNLKLERNLQIPAYIDTIVLEPKSDKQKSITIIDYKTGNRDFSKITFLDKLQALLMSTSVFCSFIDTTINYKPSDWDAAHSIDNIHLPHLERRAILGPHKFNNSITDYELLFRLKDIENSVTFILRNPVNNASIKVDYAPIAKRALKYLNDLNEFYFERKAQLKQSNIRTFRTPQFTPEKILDYDRYKAYSQYTGVQRAFI